MPSPFDVVLEAPFGKLGVRVANGALRELAYLSESMLTVDSPDVLIARLTHQLDAYYIDAYATFDTPLAPAGTDFQLCVWQAISAIPYGSVVTYDTIAQQIGSVSCAIEQVCGDNWSPILILCHRVVSTSGIGRLSHHTDGYLLNVKHWLLCYEGVILI